MGTKFNWGRALGAGMSTLGQAMAQSEQRKREAAMAEERRQQQIEDQLMLMRERFAMNHPARIPIGEPNIPMAQMPPATGLPGAAGISPLAGAMVRAQGPVMDAEFLPATTSDYLRWQEQKLAASKPATDKNIDPLSDEGVDAYLERLEGALGIKAEYNTGVGGEETISWILGDDDRIPFNQRGKEVSSSFSEFLRYLNWLHPNYAPTSEILPAGDPRNPGEGPMTVQQAGSVSAARAKETLGQIEIDGPFGRVAIPEEREDATRKGWQEAGYEQIGEGAWANADDPQYRKILSGMAVKLDPNLEVDPATGVITDPGFMWFEGRMSQEEFFEKGDGYAAFKDYLKNHVDLTKGEGVSDISVPHLALVAKKNNIPLEKVISEIATDKTTRDIAVYEVKNGVDIVGFDHLTGMYMLADGGGVDEQDVTGREY